MRWVFLSPHFDDVVLSCGGMVWEQVQSGQTVEIWTVCAGSPGPDEPLSDFARMLHERWGTGVEAAAARRAEDEAAAGRLGASLRYWDLPDCIYRRVTSEVDGGEERWLVNGEDDLWQPVHPGEEGVINRLVRWLTAGLDAETQLVSPLTLGHHVDHRLVREAAERTASQMRSSLYYYPDYPYAVRAGGELLGEVGQDWQQLCQPVSREALRAWQEAVFCYTSQMSTFWKNREDMEAALEDYWQSGGGTCLWRPV